MSYEDRLRIQTPEGVDIELTLAGLGSRLSALFIDAALRFALYAGFAAVLFLPVLAAGGRGAMLALALYLMLFFVIEFGYDIAFELLAAGRTPGKKRLGLRVVRTGGQPVDGRSSVVRNLLRLVDGVGTGFVVGIVSVIVSSRNQRLGDIAAGTVVIREATGVRPRFDTEVATAHPDAHTWDVSGVSADDLAAVRRFLDRRRDLAPDARERIAWELTERLRSKVVGAPERIAPETFLEGLAATKGSRS